MNPCSNPQAPCGARPFCPRWEAQPKAGDIRLTALHRPNPAPARPRRDYAGIGKTLQEGPGTPEPTPIPTPTPTSESAATIFAQADAQLDSDERALISARTNWERLTAQAIGDGNIEAAAAAAIHYQTCGEKILRIRNQRMELGKLRKEL